MLFDAPFDMPEKVDPTATYILRTEMPLNQAQVEHVMNIWRGYTQANLVLIGGGMTLDELTDEALRDIGFQRIPLICGFCNQPLSGGSHGAGFCREGFL